MILYSQQQRNQYFTHLVIVGVNYNQSQNKIMMNHRKGIFLKKRHIGVEINHDFCTQLQGIKYQTGWSCRTGTVPTTRLGCKNWS
jgi:hypothetical protein